MTINQRLNDFLKARFLIDDNAIKNWIFIIYLMVLALIMIANIHRYESKIFLLADLSKEVKELRAEFVDRRSELMKLRMESTVMQKMALRDIKPSEQPPIKIKVITEIDTTSWYKKLWK